MARPRTSEEKYEQMLNTPIRRLICQLAIPTMISMLVTSVYNMADTYFVGKIGTSATGGVGVAFPLMMIIQAIGFTFGMGSGNRISRLLGQKEEDEAAKVASTGFFTTFFLGCVLAVIGLIFLDPLVELLGATETIAPYAKDYIQYILIGTPFMASSFVLNNVLRYQGSAFYAMLGIATGGILNIGLDPLFMFTFGFGTAGAAMATILSQFISFCILLFNQGKNGNLRLTIKNFSPKWEMYKEILKIGLPSFYRQGIASIATVLLNFAAGGYGDAAIAAMSVVSKVLMLAFSALLGFGQGFQPACGFNYGAKKYDRVREGFWFCVRTGAIGLAVLCLIAFPFSEQIITIFRRGDPEVIRIGALALRLNLAVFPLQAWVVVCNMFMQNIGEVRTASILSLARQGLFFIPAILTLPHFFGLFGVQITQPAADLATFCLALPLGIKVLGRLKALEESENAPPQMEQLSSESEGDI
ncbi:MAG TPA: MATE family efflux transporter [Candidatus Acidoferrum sp.]|nr:MATE family efflux transporter [Candidatus Acidoferrum sp.]